ncbi:hypothetical protein MTO96_015731 [Rhipicephalus appendiculatus]
MSSAPITTGKGTGGTPVSPAVTNSGNQPTFSEYGSTINILFPIPQALVCPKEGCHTKYAGVTWTSRRQSLMSHLLDEHGMKVTAAYTCIICSDPNICNRPTYHACISRGRYELQANAPPSPQVPGMSDDLAKQERAGQSLKSPQEEDRSTADSRASSSNSSYHDSHRQASDHDQPNRNCSTCEGHVYAYDKAINTRRPKQTAPPALQAGPAPQRARREPALAHLRRRSASSQVRKHGPRW